MAKAKLLIDENVHERLAEALRRRSFDAITVSEVSRKGRSDPEQLDFAISQERAVLTFNLVDYERLAVECFHRSREHFGIIVSPERHFRDLLSRVLKLLREWEADDFKDQIIYL
ncbi:DUF5615 family PIN-like protein [Candidatus Acetothermia bacterium]|jgi:predicted nuclease of predicted toxin-antitoxin system|nr:DUF5615 family PIN-like protein [Candidatus Acetothermia bacterium]MCI2431409.1 DUF5615 family PIN-like protein [Candidatus Acetothermia bacterium]MCI2436176.1 DUF5615 family PIN-like protein [Candidatus Acetothermia bacterium]